MIRRSLRFCLLTLLVAPATGGASASAQDPSILAQVQSWYAKTSRSAPGKWGVVVADQTGNVIWQVNGSEPMVPASTVKLLTTGFARTVVGGEARRATRVVGDGHLDPATGTWMGRWALELNGDPSLDRPDRSGPTMMDLAHQLAAIGVRRLVGPLTITTAAGEPKSVFPSVWSNRFRGRSYAPPIGPITLNENIIAFSVVPGYKAGVRALIAGEAPVGVAGLITVTATTTTGRKSSLRFGALPGGRYLVSGKIGLLSRGRRYTAVASDPSAVLEAVWRHATTTAGITWVPTTALVSSDPSPRRVLAEVASETFDSLAHEINTRSLNIGAELLLLWGGGPKSPAEALMAHVRQVTGLSEGMHLVDGSGLSSDDRVTPLIFTTYLARIPQTPGGHNFPMLLPANGSGTLRRLRSGLPEPGVVRAKTGTLANAATLVGYLGRADGTLLIAMMYNGGSVYAARQAEWTLFRRLGANGIVIPSDDTAASGGPVVPDHR
jgi:D-alanyl-D-alanine carboxypeptidase/D-alanyl-D-alanine-endopeptidase (penicillin-binding protein 4)